MKIHMNHHSSHPGIFIIIGCCKTQPFSSWREGPWWRVAPSISCLASIGGPGSSSIFFGWFVVLKIKLRERERVKTVSDRFYYLFAGGKQLKNLKVTFNHWYEIMNSMTRLCIIHIVHIHRIGSLLGHRLLHWHRHVCTTNVYDRLKLPFLSGSFALASSIQTMITWHIYQNQSSVIVQAY